MRIKEHITIEQNKWNKEYLERYVKLYVDTKLSKKLKEIDSDDVLTLELNFYVDGNEVARIVHEINELENKLKNKSKE